MYVAVWAPACHRHRSGTWPFTDNRYLDPGGIFGSTTRKIQKKMLSLYLRASEI